LGRSPGTSGTSSGIGLELQVHPQGGGQVLQVLYFLRKEARDLRYIFMKQDRNFECIILITSGTVSGIL
jgi:hypothetical protein